MIFSSMIFLFVFLPIIITGYYGLLQKQNHRNIFLFIISILFYAWGEPYYIVIMLFSIVTNYRFGLWVDSCDDEKARKNILACGIFVNLMILFIFKYEGFITREFNEVIGSFFVVRLEGLNLPLPIGISFFTFQAISYLIDVYRKEAEVQKSLLNLGLYISFFPQLVAGPIVRYRTIAEEINNRETTYAQFTIGVKRFIIGLSKKIIIANQVSIIATDSFAASELSISYAWLGAICYMLQIYFDFSGYSDMAIGLGKMFGFNFMENFNYPYMANTITDFWRRWHISLGSWFRDYVYIPLGGSRVKKTRLVFNLLAVWLLTGIWHGAAWHFIAWGLLYFGLLTIEKTLNVEKMIKNNILGILYRVFTLLMVLIGWVIFGEGSLSHGFRHIKHMFGLYDTSTLIGNDFIQNINNDWVIILLAILFSTPLIVKLIEKIHATLIVKVGRYQGQYLIAKEWMDAIIYMALLIISISYLVIGSHNPFIYFNF